MGNESITTYLGDRAGLKNRIELPRILQPEHYEIEREAVFKRAWMPVIETAELPHRGSYKVLDMPVMNTSLLIVRGNDDRIRAFHNICRHRGNKVVREGAGVAKHFTCAFHAWSYDLDGSLTAVTDKTQFPDVEFAKYGLLPVHTETWEGLVFVNFDAKPRQSLREWMGPMFDQYSGYYGGHELVASHAITAKCSWHLGVNAFTEGYHTLYIHKNTVPDYQGGNQNPERHRPHIELLHRHTRYSAPANPGHVITPGEKMAYKWGQLLFPDFRVDGSHLPPGVNPAKVKDWAFDVVEFFPCAVLLFGTTWHMNIWFWPIDAGHTRIQIDSWAYRAKNAGERIGQAFYKVRGREVFREDVNTLEATQAMLSSQSMPHIVLSFQETALMHHYRMLDEMLAEARA